MRNKIFFSIIIAMSCVAQYSGAENADHTSDHEELRALRKSIVEGLDKQDVDLLAPHLAKQFVYTGVDQTVISDLQGLKSYFIRIFKSPDAPLKNMTIEASADIPTRFIADNVGICYGTAKETYKLQDGKEAVLHSRWTATCIKEEGQWKISAVQSGVNVLDNTVLNKTKNFWMKCTGAGVVAGSLLGVMVSLMVFKRKNS